MTDNPQHEDARARGNAWWSSMSDDERAAWQDRAQRLNDDWTAAARAGVDPASDEAQAIAVRHVEWIATIPNTTLVDGAPSPSYVVGLSRMYAGDERFAANYGGLAGAAFVRDALEVWAARLPR